MANEHDTPENDESTGKPTAESGVGPGHEGGISRRGFLQTAGIGAAAGAAACAPTKPTGRAGPGPQPPQPAQPDKVLGPTGVAVRCHVNGKAQTLTVETRATVADTLRDQLDLTGTKVICDRGACGGCTVIVDGQAVNACLMLAVDLEGHKVVTIEGLARGDKLHPLQSAFIEHDALQCGYCTPGMIMASKALIDRNRRPTREQIKDALAGNLCRCGTYPHVFSAVEQAAKGGS